MLWREWHEHLVSNDLNGATVSAFGRIVHCASCRSSVLLWCRSPVVPRLELAPPTSVLLCEQQIRAPLRSSCRGAVDDYSQELQEERNMQFGKYCLLNYIQCISFTPAIHSSMNMFCPEALELPTCVSVFADRTIDYNARQTKDT